MRILRILLSVIVSAVLVAGPTQAWGAARQSQNATTGPAASGDWWAAVQQNIRSAEYAVTWQDRTYLPAGRAAYQAPNRVHNLRTYFAQDGIRVIPRTWTDATPDWEWGLHLIGYGTSAVQAPAPATLLVSENRIEYRRGALVEWYVNEERGLEQGFTVAAPPAQPGALNELQIDLTVVGTLRPLLQADGQAITWLDAAGTAVLRYDRLSASDASGRVLAARMEVGRSGRMIRLLVDTTGAVYPLTIDPIVTALLAPTPVWTGEGNQFSADFGFSVATAGDVNGDGFSDVIVGAILYDNGQTDEGRVYVFHGSVSGPGATPVWTAESNQQDARFGYSVATAGDVNGDGFSDVIVGAIWYDNGQTDEGRVFAFHGSAGGLGLTAAWTAESNQASAQLGVAVGPAGDVNGDGFSDVIVGANLYDGGQSDEGRVLVYHGSAGGLGAAAAWTVESNQSSAQFGGSASTAGDVNGDGFSDVIIGARSYNGGEFEEGRAFVYHGSAGGLGLSPAWTAESNQNSAHFGAAVATAGDVNGDGYADVVVGALHFDNGQTDEGRIFVYYGSAAGLALTPAVSAEGNQVNGYFGAAVGTAGDVNGDGYADLLAGAHGYDGGHTDEGRAVLFRGSANGLAGTAVWNWESNQTSALFGAAVATAGDVNGDGFSDVIVGAYAYDAGQVNEGRAFVFLGSPDTLTLTYQFSQGDQNYASFGHAVASAGDVNGDGYADVIVGAYQFDNGQADEGRSFVFHGSANGPSMTPAWTAEGNQAGAAFGFSVAAAGDVNGDGYGDVVVGARRYDAAGLTDQGRVVVYHGSVAGLNVTPNWAAGGNQAFAYFGHSVGTAGDVNGDGFADVIIGADAFDNGQTNEGRAYLFHGSPGGLNAGAPFWTAESDQAYAYFGRTVGTAGDVNRDGFSDVIVGAYLYDSGNTDEGQAFVYLGSGGGLNLNPVWTAGGNQNYARFGYAVATAGDVNGDGYADVIIGAQLYDNGQTDEGSAFVYYGGSSGPSGAFVALESNQTGAFFGESVATAGDVNGDGYADVIVGAPSYDGKQVNGGRVTVHPGSPAGFLPPWVAYGNQTGAWFGGSVAGAGDVNADGFADIVVGARRYDNGQTDEGGTFVYFGGGGPGVRHRPRQLRISGGPIAHLGKSDSSTGFLLAVRGRTPFGRGRVKMEVEVKPLGVAFDGTGLLQTTNWQDTGVNGVNMSRTLGGLLPMTAYHWRIRILFHPARSPFQQRGRWLMMPWNGWNEKDLRTF